MPIDHPRDTAAESGRTGGRSGLLFAILSVLYIGFHLSTAGFISLSELHQRSIHLGFSLLLLYLPLIHLAEGSAKPLGRTAMLLRWLAVGFSVVSCAYVFFEEPRIVEAFAIEATPTEMLLTIGLTLLILEGARRTTGPILPILAITAVAYTLFGNYIPGWWGHPGFELTYVIEHLFLGTEAIFGRITGLSAGLIAVFIIFGCFLLVTGAADTFMKLALIAAGRAAGGAAKVATISSAFFGSINGAAVANVATTGNFTIPAMMRLGYRPSFAGAVEAVASSGGQITPPIMGTAAFVMAELLNIPYATIALAAALPAVLFYVTVWFSIDVEARRENLRPFERHEVPTIREALYWRDSVPLALTIGVLLFAMSSGLTLTLCAFLATMTNIVLFLLIGRTDGGGLKSKLKTLLDGAELGTRRVATLVPLLICAQITLSLVALSGIGIKLSELILSVGSGHGLLFGALLALVVSMVLGMGMPTTAAYLLAAAVCGPALTGLGVPTLVAHLFIFYGALLSALTPPVCTAVFTASVITQTHWWPIALTSVRLALMKFMLPFFFLYRPALVLEGNIQEILWSTAAGIVAAFLFAVGAGGFYYSRIGWLLRAACIALAIGTIPGNPYLDLAAFVVMVAFIVFGRNRRDRAATNATASE
ncbi:MAG: TRAP transporter fused permease subunit [Alphaproteobacteria bacterium]|nr:TRAP transporter fused permease subunit [Alphaproteobacteria bacterium]